MIKFKDIYQCEDTDHVYAIVRTGPLATHMVRMGRAVASGGPVMPSPHWKYVPPISRLALWLLHTSNTVF